MGKKKIAKFIIQFLLRTLTALASTLATHCVDKDLHITRKETPYLIGIQSPKYSCMPPQVKFYVDQIIFSVTRRKFFAVSFTEQRRVNSVVF